MLSLPCLGGLLAYFQDLASGSKDIDYNVIEQFVENGADINATSETTGEGIMHEVAANWDKEVAVFLLKRGVDIDLKDKDGRTPLHVAASTNHSEMIEWLVEQGAELEARTNVEKQTPLHHAARYDSILAIQALTEKGGMCYVLLLCIQGSMGGGFPPKCSAFPPKLLQLLFSV